MTGGKSNLPASVAARLLGAFLLPVLEDVQRGTRREGIWSPGGPWQPSKEPAC